MSKLVAGWERGFPSEVTGYFQDLQHLWPELVYRIPVRKLHVYEVNASEAAEFVAWPELSVLRELVLDAAWSEHGPSDIIPPLVASAGLTGLVSLDVRGANLIDANVVAVLDSPHLARLKICHLRYGTGANSLSSEVRDRFHARFGPEAMIDDEIPF
jgi:hypothetical protein